MITSSLSRSALRLQMKEHAAEVRAGIEISVRSADAGIERSHRGILSRDVRKPLLVATHLLECRALFGFGLNQNLVVVGIRNESFRNSNEQISRGDQYQDAERQRSRPMPQNPLQAVIVEIQHPVENALGCA